MNEPERRSTRHTGTRSAYSRTECDLGTVRYRHLPFEQDLRVSEPLRFAPRSKAMRALPFRRNCTVSGWGSGLRWRLLSEQRAAEEKRRASPPVGHPPEVTDAGKAFWQHMHQEPAQELLVGKSHGAVLALVGVVFPAKSYAVVVDAKQTVVGNGDSMGVTGQVLQNVFRTAERRLGVTTHCLREMVSRNAAKFFSLASGAHSPKKASLWLRNACRKPSVNLRRKTRLSTFTGRMKRGPEPIQRV